MADGGAILIPKSPSLSRYLQWLNEQRIDHCWFPDELLDRPATPLDRDHCLEVAWVAGSTPEIIERLEQRFGIDARECYGMTEIGMATIVPNTDRDMAMTGSIGIAAPFREVKIISADGDDAPTNEVGELCVRGAGILRGYHNRPDANAELFGADGWFRTGDLASIDENGLVFFVGRIKDMIRRSGENISAAEVEHAANEMPEIEISAAVPVPDSARGEEVKLYVVLRSGESPATVAPDLIYAWCSERLARFKVPRYLEYRSELPITPSEKISKGKLKDEKPDLRADSYDRVDAVWR
jgi:acyl-CoA synthetase (AMP-forming)/AMP-acid ligase II